MSQSSWIEKDHQDQIRHANDWQVLAIFKRTVEHQPKLPGGKPYAEDETSFSPVRVLVSRPGPLDQHGAADPMVHVIHCTGSMRGRLLHEEQKNASCLCNRCPGPNCHPSCCHGVCVSMSYLPFHIYEKKITSGSSISSTHTWNWLYGCALRTCGHLELHCEQSTSHIARSNSNMFLNHLLASLKRGPGGGLAYIYIIPFNGDRQAVCNERLI